MAGHRQNIRAKHVSLAYIVLFWKDFVLNQSKLPLLNFGWRYDTVTRQNICKRILYNFTKKLSKLFVANLL